MAGRPPRVVATRPRPGMPIDVNVTSKLVIKHTGNLSRVAQALGVDRNSIRQVVERNPDLKQLVSDQRERYIDELEDSAFTRAIDGDTSLTMFLLKTQARHRGYDVDMSNHQAKDIATAAFEFILNKSKTPVQPAVKPKRGAYIAMP